MTTYGSGTYGSGVFSLPFLLEYRAGGFGGSVGVGTPTGGVGVGSPTNLAFRETRP